MDQRDRRLAELGLTDLCAYRAFLTSSPTEWARLAMCRIPISRFYRDRGAFDIIIRQLLPQLAAMASARGMAGIKCWSAGCASGEEPYYNVVLEPMARGLSNVTFMPS
jgi:chemotaxis protein methyltransferase CheR